MKPLVLASLESYTEGDKNTTEYLRGSLLHRMTLLNEYLSSMKFNQDCPDTKFADSIKNIIKLLNSYNQSGCFPVKKEPNQGRPLYYYELMVEHKSNTITKV